MQNSPEKNVLDFYTLTIKLKDLVRSGWKQWNVPRERLESVAEHVFSTSMLAIAIDSEFHYNINFEKVILMITVHELEEIVISDITPYDGVDRIQKLKQGHEAIEKILSPLKKDYKYITLIHEFDARITPEAKFAYMSDKLDADLMAEYYDQNHECTITNATEKLQNNKEIQRITRDGKDTMSDAFYLVEIESKRFDENFTRILQTAREYYTNLHNPEKE